jgi:hypothetical protein
MFLINPSMLIISQNGRNLCEGDVFNFDYHRFIFNISLRLNDGFTGNKMKLITLFFTSNSGDIFDITLSQLPNFSEVRSELIRNNNILNSFRVELGQQEMADEITVYEVHITSRK